LTVNLSIWSVKIFHFLVERANNWRTKNISQRFCHITKNKVQTMTCTWHIQCSWINFKHPCLHTLM
jgi:hypothetical protein